MHVLPAPASLPSARGFWAPAGTCMAAAATVARNLGRSGGGAHKLSALLNPRVLILEFRPGFRRPEASQLLPLHLLGLHPSLSAPLWGCLSGEAAAPQEIHLAWGDGHSARKVEEEETAGSSSLNRTHWVSRYAVWRHEGYVPLTRGALARNPDINSIDDLPGIFRILTALIHVCEALAYLHGGANPLGPTLHLDIKPRNVLVDPQSGHAVIIDLEQAVLLPRREAFVFNHVAGRDLCTEKAMPIGTRAAVLTASSAHYAPERTTWRGGCSGDVAIGEAADVFGVGQLALEALGFSPLLVLWRPGVFEGDGIGPTQPWGFELLHGLTGYSTAMEAVIPGFMQFLLSTLHMDPGRRPRAEALATYLADLRRVVFSVRPPELLSPQQEEAGELHALGREALAVAVEDDTLVSGLGVKIGVLAPEPCDIGVSLQSPARVHAVRARVPGEDKASLVLEALVPVVVNVDKPGIGDHAESTYIIVEAVSHSADRALSVALGGCTARVYHGRGSCLWRWVLAEGDLAGATAELSVVSVVPAKECEGHVRPRWAQPCYVRVARILEDNGDDWQITSGRPGREVEEETWGPHALVVIEGVSVVRGTLTVREGTLVVLRKKARLLISGRLHLLGNEDAPVLITAVRPDEPWGELRVEGGTVIAIWAIITGGGGDYDRPRGRHCGTGAAISAEDAVVTLEAASIIDCSGKAIESKRSAVYIVDSLISRVNHGGEHEESLVRVVSSRVVEIPDGVANADKRLGSPIDEDNDGIYLSKFRVEAQDTFWFRRQLAEEFRATAPIARPDLAILDARWSAVIYASVFAAGADDAVDVCGAEGVFLGRLVLEDWLHEGLAASMPCSVARAWEDKKHPAPLGILLADSIVTRCEQGVEVGYGSQDVTLLRTRVSDNEVGVRFGDPYAACYGGSIRLAAGAIVERNAQYNGLSWVWVQPFAPTAAQRRGGGGALAAAGPGAAAQLAGLHGTVVPGRVLADPGSVVRQPVLGVPVTRGDDAPAATAVQGSELTDLGLQSIEDWRTLLLGVELVPHEGSARVHRHAQGLLACGIYLKAYAAPKVGLLDVFGVSIKSYFADNRNWEDESLFREAKAWYLSALLGLGVVLPTVGRRLSTSLLHTDKLRQAAVGCGEWEAGAPAETFVAAVGRFSPNVRQVRVQAPYSFGVADMTHFGNILVYALFSYLANCAKSLHNHHVLISDDLDAAQARPALVMVDNDRCFMPEALLSDAPPDVRLQVAHWRDFLFALDCRWLDPQEGDDPQTFPRVLQLLSDHNGGTVSSRLRALLAMDELGDGLLRTDFAAFRELDIRAAEVLTHWERSCPLHGVVGRMHQVVNPLVSTRWGKRRLGDECEAVISSPSARVDDDEATLEAEYDACCDLRWGPAGNPSCWRRSRPSEVSESNAGRDARLAFEVCCGRRLIY